MYILIITCLKYGYATTFIALFFLLIVSKLYLLWVADFSKNYNPSFKGKADKNHRVPFYDNNYLLLNHLPSSTPRLSSSGRPPPRISWYSGDSLVDASDGTSDVPGIRENELYLPLTRENAASLTCRASNTHLTPPIVAGLHIELYCKFTGSDQLN